MSRVPLPVRPAAPEDASAVLELWTTESSRIDPSETGVAADHPRLQEAASRIADIAADPAEQLLIAESDGKVVGAVHLRRGPISPVQLAEAVHVTHLQVASGCRRRGVASALLSAATAWADEKDSAHLIAAAPASSREAHRFLARLGFVQVAVVRAVTTSALRQRFSAPTASRETKRLLAARRTLRRRREALATG